jgi:hypothetical protein
LRADGVRERLAVALPALRSSEARCAEERCLFAHLLGMSGRATLSWRSCDSGGRPTAPSPLLERLRLVGRVSLPESASAAFPLGADPALGSSAKPAWAARPWAALPSSVLMAAAGAGPWIEPLWRRLVQDNEAGAEGYARLRSQILAVLERAPSAEGRSGLAQLAPWYGAVGPWAAGAHEGTTEMWATRLEAVARCPWQTFLSRGLGLEAPADAVDGLPDVEARVVGDVVHAALATLLRPGLSSVVATPSLDDLAARGPSVVSRPSDSALDRAVRSCSQRAARSEGYARPEVMERVLAAMSRPYVCRGVDLLWGRAPLSVLAAEVEGSADASALDAGSPELRFRADAALMAGGRLGLVDFKTGRSPFAGVRTTTTRVARLRAQMRQGRWLQGALYALARGERGVDGEYLFLSPDHRPDEVSLALTRPEDGRLWLADGLSEPAPLDVPVAEVVAAVTAMWRDGLLPPRLEVPVSPAFAPAPEPEEAPANRACAWCEVRPACVRGDSGHRIRLRHRAWAAWKRWCDEPDLLEDGLVARLFRGDLGADIGGADE